MPPIFAYSALVTDEVTKKTAEVGFLECIESPPREINRIICQYIDQFAENYIRD